MIQRIKSFIENQNLSSSGFANEIGVQRSSVSHILSGRNKPSLDFILKFKEHYPDLNFEWLLTGKGGMFVQKEKVAGTDKPGGKRKAAVKETGENELSLFADEQRPFSETKQTSPDMPGVVKDEEMAYYGKTNVSKKIKKIILLYQDNSFEEFKPE
ncbi:MAG: helix-turn-helix transcriptional regulator [Chlorobi bacterium]|nr:helix-turn-helix transcriptional regulator [Chlorobiota bacterium]